MKTIDIKTNGRITANMRSLMRSTAIREYVLYDLLPNESYMSDIFIGFTQNGQHFLSYSKSEESNTIVLHIFQFNGNQTLQLIASHIIFTGNSFDLNDFSDSRLFEGVYCYQWSSNDNYLLTIVAPQYPNSRLIDVTLIRIDEFGSYIVSPGSQTFSCNGFGRIPEFCDENSLSAELSNTINEESMTPKIVLNKPKVCAFITDSEIVCLEIKEDINPRTGLLDTRLESKVLDVESNLFRDIFNKLNFLHLFSYVSEYELLVYDIELDPIIIYSLLEVMFVKNGKKLLHSFSIKWEPKSMEWNLNLFSQNNEHEDHNSYYTKLVEIIKANRKLSSYSINNLSLAENQKSLTRLDSPVDAISIILNPSL
jgi:hypothetical protein